MLKGPKWDQGIELLTELTFGRAGNLQLPLDLPNSFNIPLVEFLYTHALQKRLTLKLLFISLSDTLTSICPEMIKT